MSQVRGVVVVGVQALPFILALLLLCYDYSGFVRSQPGADARPSRATHSVCRFRHKERFPDLLVRFESLKVPE